MNLLLGLKPHYAAIFACTEEPDLPQAQAQTPAPYGIDRRRWTRRHRRVQVLTLPVSGPIKPAPPAPAACAVPGGWRRLDRRVRNPTVPTRVY